MSIIVPLGPAIIFMMIVGAFRSSILAFESSPAGAFFMVLIPLVLFTVVCLVAPEGWQVRFCISHAQDTIRYLFIGNRMMVGFTIADHRE